MKETIEKCFDWWREQEPPMRMAPCAMRRLRDRLLCEFADEHKPTTPDLILYGNPVGEIICARCGRVLPGRHTCGACEHYWDTFADLRKHVEEKHNNSVISGFPPGTRSSVQ